MPFSQAVMVSGWAVMRDQPFQPFIELFPTSEAAQAKATSMGPGYLVKYGQQQVGTRNFVYGPASLSRAYQLARTRAAFELGLFIRMRSRRSSRERSGYSDRHNGHPVHSEQIRLRLDADRPVCNREVRTEAGRYCCRLAGRGQKI